MRTQIGTNVTRRFPGHGFPMSAPYMLRVCHVPFRSCRRVSEVNISDLTISAARGHIRAEVTLPIDNVTAAFLKCSIHISCRASTIRKS
jgi:hypothetical protein